MTVSSVLQVILALGLFNVWLIRSGKATGYRGGRALNLKEEFKVYGLPAWFFTLTGALKIGSAIGLLGGIFIPELALASAGLLMVLMLGALAMHVKVKDPLQKSLPALAMLLISGTVVLTSPILSSGL